MNHITPFVIREICALTRKVYFLVFGLLRRILKRKPRHFEENGYHFVIGVGIIECCTRSKRWWSLVSQIFSYVIVTF